MGSWFSCGGSGIRGEGNMGPAEVVSQGVPKTGLSLSRPAAAKAAIPDLAKPLSPAPTNPDDHTQQHGDGQATTAAAAAGAAAVVPATVAEQQRDEEYFKDMEPEIKQAPTIDKEVATTKKSERLQLRGTAADVDTSDAWND